MSEALAQVFEEFGIEFRTNARSFILKDCPSCGRSSNTVWMFRPEEEDSTRTGGQCWVCGTRFSTYSYIVEFGHEAREVRRALGIGRHSPDLSPESWVLPDFSIDKNTQLDESLVQADAYIPEHYHKIWDWPNHPASKYARGRGLIGVLGRSAWIDPFTNSVAFSIESQGVHVGFQKRFVDPNAFLKTKTDGNIPRARSFIKFGTLEQPVCVVEGPFDAVAACWFGYYGLCTMGAAITRTQAQEIAMLAYNQCPENPRVYIGLDDDDAGERGARFLARLLDSYGIGFVRLLPEKGYKDFNEALVEGSGLNLFEQEEILNIDGLVREKDEWHWSVPSLDGFRYKVGIDYKWSDFKEDATTRAEKRRKYMERLKREDPEKYKEACKRAEERRAKKQKRFSLEGIL